MNEQRLNYLDMVKGIGIVLVVIGHAPRVSENTLIWLSSFHMPLFFIVSGVLFAYKSSVQEPFVKYIQNRFCSIMIPYFWFSLINILIDCCRFAYNPDAVVQEVIGTDIIQTLSFFGISVLWFLPTIFLAELCLYSIIKKCSIWLICVISVVSVFLPPICAQLVETHFLADKTIFLTWLGYMLIGLLRIFPALMFLLIGYVIYIILQRFQLKAVLELLLGTGCLFLNIAVAFANGKADFQHMNNVLYYYLGASSAALGIIMICRHIKALWFLIFFGKNSLIIMLTHLDCRIMRIAIKIAEYVNQLIPVAVMYQVSLYLALLLGELIMIVLINRFGFFLIGRKKTIKMERPQFWYENAKDSSRKIS